ncbi:efflux RND transporter permease subunit [bacterium]|jgi:multidrug efflux pump subunit AcrB|nr:efflux RND transporter permease subunit [bacterium]MDB4796773.1 efflux RND transporter permease subunit [bacterium]
MIRWFANNDIAANFLMVGILLAGIYTAFFRIPLEVSPSRTFDGIYFSMSYRGGTAKDVEKGILIPVEEALEGLNGIKEINADGYRDRARIWIEAEEGYNMRVLLDDIQSRVDGITTFPSETERPEIKIPDSSQFYEVLSVAVTGRLDADELRKVSRRVQEDLLEIDGISLVNLSGDRDYEISVEADPERLKSYGLGLSDLANAVRRSSVDLPAGSIQSESGSLVVRTRGQAYTKADFSKIPVRASNGAEVQLGEVANVRDGFEEGEKIVEFNDKPALFVEVMRTGAESAIDIANKVTDYVNNSSNRFPDGIELYTFDDQSISIRGRLNALTSSLIQGSILVFIVLGLFLRPMLAFWVVIGIPVCFAGGVLMMPTFGVTANVMSVFGFIIVVGVVVDDAIVTGENIYSKMREGIDPLEASITGAHEVAVPVTFGVLTTVVAFLPLMFFDGRWGTYARQIPPVVGPVLLFSLIESKLILPAHLKHLKMSVAVGNPFLRFQDRIARGLELFVQRVYQPILETCVRRRALVAAVFAAMALVMAGYCQGGRLGFVSMPSVDRLKVTAYLSLSNDTTIENTHRYVERIVAAAETLKSEFVDLGTGTSLIKSVMKVSGARHMSSSYDKSRAYIAVEVVPPSLRSVPGPRNSEIANRWTELVGPIPEARYFRIRGEESSGRDDEQEQESLEVELRGPSSEAKNIIAESIADQLRSFDGINSASADVNYGQDELEFTLKARAAELGLTQQMLAQQIRQSFFGEEAQRIMRGVDDIRVMVRLPREARESLHTIDRLKIRTPDGSEVPLATVANLDFVQAPSSVERNGGAEVIRIGAQPMDETVDIIGISREITPVLEDLIRDEPSLSFIFTGYVAEAAESRKRTLIGSVALFFALFALLAIPFKSMVQPFYVLIAVPFGVIGALLGHIIMGITPSYLSIFGMLALAGVVVNDSLVLVDFVNRQVRNGTPLKEAVLSAGARRFRPILLTSVTTFVGLIPLLMDRSIQAQFLIPMAVSLGFGVLFATAITLILVPCALLLGQDIGKLIGSAREWYFGPFRKTDSVLAE